MPARARTTRRPGSRTVNLPPINVNLPNRRQRIHVREGDIENEIIVHKGRLEEPEIIRRGGRGEEFHLRGRERQQAQAGRQGQQEAEKPFSMKEYLEQELARKAITKRSIQEQQKAVMANYAMLEAELKRTEEEVKASTARKKDFSYNLKGKKFLERIKLRLAILRKRIRVFRNWVSSGFRISPLTGIALRKRQSWKNTRQSSGFYKRKELDENLARVSERVEKMQALLNAFRTNPEVLIESIRFIEQQPRSTKAEIERKENIWNALLKDPGRTSGALLRIKEIGSFEKREAELGKLLK